MSSVVRYFLIIVCNYVSFVHLLFDFKSNHPISMYLIYLGGTGRVSVRLSWSQETPVVYRLGNAILHTQMALLVSRVTNKRSSKTEDR